MSPSRESQFIAFQLHASADGLSAQHRGHTLRSAFQPIVSLAHCRSVGYEALVRATDAAGHAVPPPELFVNASSEAELVHLDRLCRAVHVHNFVQQGGQDSWLFLNVHPIVSVRGRHYGRFFEELLANSGLPPERVVIEILEDGLLDDQQLAAAADFYRARGCLVALDDFGIGHSNFGRIWQIKPHIVKLDRSTLTFARQNATARRVLPRLVTLLHEAGCLVLIEGIEDEYEAMLAMESDADLAQGYYFARPGAQLAPPEDARDKIHPLFEHYRTHRTPTAHDERHAQAMQDAIAEIAAGDHLDSPSIDRLLQLPHAERSYLIDHAGRQIGDSRLAHDRCGTDRRFKPLEHANDALWLHRSYWRRALQQHGTVQATRPYLSASSGALYVTLSICFGDPQQPRVLCLDLRHDDLQPCAPAF